MEEARNPIDQLNEVTAIVETLRVVVASLATQVPDREALLRDYDAGTATLLALCQGQTHTDRYLEQLEEHIRKTRVFLGS